MSDLLELARGLVGRRIPGEQLEAYLVRGDDTEIRAYDGAVENLMRATSEGLGVRVLLDGPDGPRVGASYVGSLDAASVDEALGQARANARYAAPDPFVALASPDGVAAVALDLCDERVASTPIEEKVALALDLERRVRGDGRIRQVESADYRDSLVEVALASSAGIEAVQTRTRASLSVVALASDGERDYSGWGLSYGRSPTDLSIDEAATDAIGRAVAHLGSIKPSTSRGVAIFDPRTAAALFSLVAVALSGEEVERGRSFFAGRLGEMVATEDLTLVDDATDVRHAAAGAWDGEGLASRRTVLIDRGRLAAFVYDTVSARRAGARSTGNAVRGSLAASPHAACRALAPLAGREDPGEIIERVGDGVFVDGLHGLHSGVNPISGDFSVGVTGRLVRDGQLAEPIREATVASTLQRMLLDVVAVGSDLEFRPGSSAGLTLAIDGMTLSGR